MGKGIRKKNTTIRLGRWIIKVTEIEEMYEFKDKKYKKGKD